MVGGRGSEPGSPAAGARNADGRRAPWLIRVLIFLVVSVPLGCGTLALTVGVGFFVFLVAALIAPSAAEGLGVIPQASFAVGIVLAFLVLRRLAVSPPQRLRGLLPTLEDLRINPWLWW